MTKIKNETQIIKLMCDMNNILNDLLPIIPKNNIDLLEAFMMIERGYGKACNILRNILEGNNVSRLHKKTSQ